MVGTRLESVCGLCVKGDGSDRKLVYKSLVRECFEKRNALECYEEMTAKRDVIRSKKMDGNDYDRDNRDQARYTLA